MTPDLRDTEVVEVERFELLIVPRVMSLDSVYNRSTWRLYWQASAVVILAIFVAACAGPREAVDDEDADDLPTPAVRMADYEDFDPAPYREEGVRPGIEVEHDVPARLMEGRADEGVQAQVQGYRVQVYSSLDRDEAIAQEEAAKTWWQSNSEAAPSGVSELPVYSIYIQPYYRVRVGNFTSREAAERARNFLSQRFPDAFIVPDTVEITR